MRRELDQLPNPEMYASWQDFARAQNAALQEASREWDTALRTYFRPAGTIAATNVQAAIEELDGTYTAADVLAKLLTVDGTGSLLDADLLDGSSGAFYLARANHTGAESIAVNIAGSGLTYITLIPTDFGVNKTAIFFSNTGATSWEMASYDNTFVAVGTIAFRAVTINLIGNTDVTGELRCDTLRIDAAATAATPTPTHTFPVSINGTVYRVPCVV